MESSTILDALLEARTLTAPIENEQHKKYKNFLLNVVSTITIIAVGLTWVLFVYNKGYASIYKLPALAMPLDLRVYLPFATKMVPVFIYVVYYIAFKYSDKVFKKKGFNWGAVAYGFIIVKMVLSNFYFERVVGQFGSSFIAAATSLIVETIPFLIKKTDNRINLDKKIDDQMKQIKMEDYIWNRIIYFLLFRCGLFVMFICVVFAPFVGKLAAIAKPEYQICTYDTQTYAVIIDYEDKVLVERAYIEDNSIVIATQNYRYLQKDSLELSFCTFDSVVIQDYLPLESSNVFYGI